MEKSKRCHACLGSGKLMGGGLILKDCKYCKNPQKEVSMRDTQAYKKSVKRIQKKCKISEQEAQKIIDRELSNEEIKTVY